MTDDEIDAQLQDIADDAGDLYAAVVASTAGTIEAQWALERMHATDATDRMVLIRVIAGLAGTVQDILDQEWPDPTDPDRLKWIAQRADAVRQT